MTKTLALFGDSFGYQDSAEEFDSWVTLLSKHYKIHNYCQAGSSQYKILKSIQLVDLDQYDHVVITHTSPGRVYVKYNPLHQNTTKHKDCDIILSDIENNSDRFSVACQLYFKYIHDMDYAIDIHNMICKEIHELTQHHNPCHITHFDYQSLYQFPGLINFHSMFRDNRGSVNHYNQIGNCRVYQTVLDKLSDSK